MPMMMHNCLYCFPWIFPVLFPIVFPMLFFFFFGKRMWGREGFGPPMMRDRGAEPTAPSPTTSGANPAIAKLQMRLAEGEITTEEFVRMKRALEG